MENLDRRLLIGAAGLAGVGVLASLAKGGPLNPPGGPVNPTGRTLDEIYDKIPLGLGDGRTVLAGGTANYTITLPGSYVLAGNLNGSITISTSDVTIDLNGFSVNATTAGSGNGIFVSSNQSRVIIRNGVVSRFNAGVVMSIDVKSVILEDLMIRECRNYGILSNSTNNRNVTVRRCNVIDTGATSTGTTANLFVTGINLTGDGHVIEDSIVQSLVYLGTGTPTFRGISLSDLGGTANIVRRCVVNCEPAVTGDGIRFFGTGVYRDNTVIGFSTAYIGGTNGGGNV